MDNLEYILQRQQAPTQENISCDIITCAVNEEKFLELIKKNRKENMK